MKLAYLIAGVFVLVACLVAEYFMPRAGGAAAIIGWVFGTTLVGVSAFHD